MKKILLVNPLLHTMAGSRRLRQPISLMLMASIIKKVGYEKVDLFDLNVSDRKIDFGLYDVVFVTTASIDRWETPVFNLKPVLQLLSSLKDGKCLTILTGPHGTSHPEEIFKYFQYKVDLIIRGEPELAIIELAKNNFDNYESISSISFLDENREIKNNPIKVIKNLDELPLPAYDLIEFEKYNYNVVKDWPKNFTIMESSRGCPFNCSFCYKAMFEKYRYQNPERVVKEMELLNKKYGVNSIYFQDLEFCLDRERVVKICELILEKKLKISWACAARVKDVDEELLSIMAKAGCKSISFGVESLSDRLLKKMNKNITVDDIIKARRMCLKFDINFNSFFTSGHLGESLLTYLEELYNSFRFDFPFPARRAMVRLYPGTGLTRFFLEKKKLSDDSWFELQKFNIKFRNKKIRMVEYLFYIFYKVAVLSRKYVFKIFSRKK